MTMTKEQARQFKASLDRGEKPPLNRQWMIEVLRMDGEEIRRLVACFPGTTRVSRYPNPWITTIKALHRIGLLDCRYNRTARGNEYLHDLMLMDNRHENQMPVAVSKEDSKYQRYMLMTQQKITVQDIEKKLIFRAAHECSRQMKH
jgi:hypothetical protein